MCLLIPCQWRICLVGPTRVVILSEGGVNSGYTVSSRVSWHALASLSFVEHDDQLLFEQFNINPSIGTFVYMCTTTHIIIPFRLSS